MQIFTYLPSTQGEPQRLLALMRAVLSAPFVVADHEMGDRHQLLGDVLGVEVASRTKASNAVCADVETLLLVLRRNGRRLMSINLYDKLAKAELDAGVVGRDVGPPETCDFLGRSIRLDATLSEGALVDLLREARLAQREQGAPTAAKLVKAMRILDSGEGRSGRSCLAWLLDYIFRKRLPLLKLLAFRPSLIDEVRAELATTSPRVLAVFDEWRRRGFRYEPAKSKRAVSFVQFATTYARRTVSRQQARSARSRCLRLGLDLDLPLVAYEVLFAQSHIWSMSADARRRFGRALERGKARSAMKHLKASRRSSEQSVAEIAAVLASMISEAHVPANTIQVKSRLDLALRDPGKSKSGQRSGRTRVGRRRQHVPLS